MPEAKERFLLSPPPNTNSQHQSWDILSPLNSSHSIFFHLSIHSHISQRIKHNWNLIKENRNVFINNFMAKPGQFTLPRHRKLRGESTIGTLINNNINVFISNLMIKWGERGISIPSFQLFGWKSLTQNYFIILSGAFWIIFKSKREFQPNSFKKNCTNDFPRDCQVQYFIFRCPESSSPPQRETPQKFN